MGAFPTDAEREAVAKALAQNLIDDRGTQMHSWRCSEPERYPNFCTCGTDARSDVLAVLAPHVAARESEAERAGAARALREAAGALDALPEDAPDARSTPEWLRERADAEGGE